MLEFLGRFFAASNPLWYYYPLALVVGLVYKATQHDQPREIVRGMVHFFVSVTLLMALMAVVLYLVSEKL